MATAAVASAMSVDGQPSLHSFFAKTHNEARRTTEDDCGPADGGADVVTSDATGPPNENNIQPPAANSTAPTKVSVEDDLDGTTAGSGLPSDISGRRELQEEGSLSRSRKRIKLSPPDADLRVADSIPLPTQELEPTATATSQQVVSNVAESAADNEKEAEQIATPSTPPQRIMDRVEIQIDGSYASRPSSGQQPDTLNNHVVKPKKMLRLRPNGKFSSPPRTFSENMSPQQKRRSRSKRVEPKQLIVVCKYPVDNSSAGRKIQRILNGEERATDKIRDAGTTHLPAKPTGPPKPTHPFFLGKAAKPQQLKVPTDAGQVLPTPKKSPVRRRATATPVKPRVLFGSLRAVPELPSASVFGGNRSSGFIKHPGARDARWPIREERHVRGHTEDMSRNERVAESLCLTENGKRTRELITVPVEEDILSRCATRIQPIAPRPRDRSLRKARRLLLSDSEIQRRVSQELSTPLYKDATDGELHDSSQPMKKSHCLLRNIYSSIPGYLSSFDRFECESKLWVDKYAPHRAEEVLQQGPETTILRDWLRRCTVTAVDTGSKGSTASFDLSNRKGIMNPIPKRKRKRAADLDDFLVSSDEDCNELEELSEHDQFCPNKAPTRSLVRGGLTKLQPGQLAKSGNVVLLSGPRGCGKTAAVYAVATELEFEVFEINPSSRRSGKDVLDKIGDMTENHLIQQVAKALSGTSSSNLQPEGVEPSEEQPDPKQKTMGSFFKATSQNKSEPGAKKIQSSSPQTEKPTAAVSKKKQSQKQSLIFLEEVDILFEEDKQFWLTVLTLAKHSKRPIIMTCNDEKLLPLDALSLHAILRFASPPADLASDYLLLLAAREGHLLRRDAITTLYQATCQDLRASIMELNFWCQMGVGAENCLEWLYQHKPSVSDDGNAGRPLRVVSEDTYLPGMGFYGRDLLHLQENDGTLYHFILEARREWGISEEDLASPSSIPQDIVLTSKPPGSIPHSSFYADYQSAADLYSELGRQSNPHKHATDPTLPTMSDRSRLNYTTGYPILEADPPSIYADLYDQLTSNALVANARLDFPFEGPSANQDSEEGLKETERALSEAILASIARQSRKESLDRSSFSILDTLAEPGSSQQVTGGLSVSSFDREFSVITTDLAPYVRRIAAYDLQLEAERLRLSNLLSAGGRTKRLRTTRAARSAFEGGKRELARRERWFDKSLNLQAVMETGGKGWSGIAGPLDEKHMDDGSVASSAQSTRTSASP